MLAMKLPPLRQQRPAVVSMGWLETNNAGPEKLQDRRGRDSLHSFCLNRVLTRKDTDMECEGGNRVREEQQA